MEHVHTTNGLTSLQQQLAIMVALEQAIAARLGDLARQAAAHQQARDLLAGLRDLAAVQAAAAAERLHAVAPEAATPGETAAPPSPLDVLYAAAGRPVSAALLSAHTLLGQAILGYSLLQALCHRHRDSSISGEPNTADLAQKHTRRYTEASQRILRLLHDALLWELSQRGDECRCTCPSCGLGVCLCATSSGRILSMAWADAGAFWPPEGVPAHRPRRGSAAAVAGLAEGDLIAAADGQAIKTFMELQQIVRDHKSGEEVRLHVQRQSGEEATLVVVRP